MDKKIQGASLYCMILLLLAGIPSSCFAQNIDIDLLKKINVNRNTSLDGSMKAITNSVYPISASIPIAELIAGYAKHDSQLISTGWTTIAGTGLNFALAFGLKYTVNRQRPYTTYNFLQPYHTDTDPSFPSGHTSFAFNTATSLALNYPQWYVVIPAYTWATTVGWSRVHLGMHYPSDVLTGAIIGSGAALLAYKGNKWLQHRKKIKHPSVEQ